MIDGIINVYKEKGYTSHDVIAQMRGILKTRKIGHTGTLDPGAEGVLPVCIGKGTKLVDMIVDKEKSYDAVLKLGVTTDSQDFEGKVLKTSEVNVGFQRIEEAVLSYIGEYLQLPPMFSAVKINGKKLYEYARKGKEVERERRKVTIKDIRILGYDEKEHELRMSVDCSRGTYIRTLLYDIGESLGCGGTMKELKRTAVGGFRIEESLTLSCIDKLFKEGRLEAYVLPADAMFPGYDKVKVNPEYHKLIYNGNPFYRDQTAAAGKEPGSALVRVYDSQDCFIGIYRYEQDDEIFKPVKMFLA